MLSLIRLRVEIPKMRLKGSLETIIRVAKFMERNVDQTLEDLIEYGKHPSAEMGYYDLEKEMDFWSQTITRVTNNSLFCQLFAEYEFYMQYLLETYYKNKGKPFYMEYRIYEEYKRFIQDKLKIADYEVSDTYLELNKYKELRNAMMHFASNYKYLDRSRSQRQLNRYLKVKDTIDDTEFISLENFLSPPLFDGTRENITGCFYIADTAFLESVSKLMLSDAEHITKALRNLFDPA